MSNHNLCFYCKKEKKYNHCNRHFKCNFQAMLHNRNVNLDILSTMGILLKELASFGHSYNGT